MKKKIRLLAFLCIVALSLTMLSSCSMLDELKEQRFVWVDVFDGIIEYKGKEYRRLENKKDVEINYNSFDFEGYVVEEDVPLLMIDFIGTDCEYDKKYDLIYCEGNIYCQQDKYEEYTKILEKAVLDHYKIDYTYYDYEDGEEKEVYVILDSQVTELINGTFKNVVGREIEEDNYFEWEYLKIDECDSIGFIHNTGVFELYRDNINNTFGICAYDNDIANYVIWEFPDEFEKIIENLFDDYYKDYIYESTYDDHYSY